MEVVVAGLVGAPQHNGKSGTVVSGANPASGRYTVQLDEGGAPLGLKPATLRPVVAAAEPETEPEPEPGHLSASAITHVERAAGAQSSGVRADWQPEATTWDSFLADTRTRGGARINRSVGQRRAPSTTAWGRNAAFAKKRAEMAARRLAEQNAAAAADGSEAAPPESKPALAEPAADQEPVAPAAADDCGKQMIVVTRRAVAHDKSIKACVLLCVGFLA